MTQQHSYPSPHLRPVYSNIHQQQNHHAPPPSMILMERLLYNLHHKCCTYALQTTSRSSRFYAEHTILIIAICCFGALLLSHRTFVFYPSSSLSSSSSSSYSTIPNPNSNYRQHHQYKHHYIPTQCLKSIPGFIADTNLIDVTHLILIREEERDDDEENGTVARHNEDATITTERTSRNTQNSYTVIHNRNRDYQIQGGSTCSSSMDGECRGRGRSRSRSDDPNGHTERTMSTSILRKDETIMFSYAREKGYLFLSSSSSSSSNTFPISTQYVYISPKDSLCFGEPFVQYLVFHLLYYILGPDTVMINWLLGTFSDPPPYTNHTTHHHHDTISTHHSGYIYNPRTNVVIDIEEYKKKLSRNGNAHYSSNYHSNGYSSNSNSNKSGSNHYRLWIRRKIYELGLKFLIVIKTSFLFFITTTLVSFTLRETQGRMLQFTQTLQQQCFNDQSPQSSQIHNPINPTPTTTSRSNENEQVSINTHQQQQQLNYQFIVQLIVTHVLENVIFVPIIVGFIYFLINFYNGDKLLAMMVLTLVWVCESFSMVSLRTEQGMQYFPLFFYFLFALFHYYQISFPYGFPYAALTTSMCFMMHSMLFFWHRYELPAVFLGRGSVSGGGNNVGSNTPIPSPPRARALTLNDGTNNTTDETMRWPVSSASVSSPPPASLPNFERVHFGRNPSFGRLSRNSSNNAIFNRGDDDDEGSYMYFMGGEVVIPRHHSDQSSSNNAEQDLQNAASPVNTTIEYVPSPSDPTRRVESAGSSLSLSSDVAAPVGSIDNSESSRSHRGRFVSELEPVVASGLSRDDDSEVHRTHDVTPDSASLGCGRNAPTNFLNEHTLEDDPYTGESNSSALQAILSALEDIDSNSTHSQNRNDAVTDGGSSTHNHSIFR